MGKLTYDDGSVAVLQAPTEGASFQVGIHGQQAVPGIYITSHRPVYSYQKVTEVPTEVQAGDQLFDQYLDNLRQYYQPRARIQSPSHRLKAALISLAMFGLGNDVIAPNHGDRRTFEGFSEVLRRVLPANLGFRRIAVRMPEVILETETGEFSLDAASGESPHLWMSLGRSLCDLARMRPLLSQWTSLRITSIRASNVLCSLDSLMPSLKHSSLSQHTTRSW